MNWKHYLENKLPICNSRNVQKGKSSMLDTCRKPLLEVCDLLDSKRVPVTSNKRIHGPYPYYGANGIQDYVNDYIFDDDLVLLAEDGGNFGSKDKPIAYRVSGKCWVNNHAHVLKPREGLNVDYLCYSLMYYDTKGLVNGATRQKLTQAAMKNIKIPILAYNEQLKIVKRIAMVSSLINNRKKELSLLDKLVKSRFIEMFGDSQSNPKGFPYKRINEFAKCIAGATPSTKRKEYWSNGIIPWMSSGEVNYKRIWETEKRISQIGYDSCSTKMIPAHTVVIAMAGQGRTRGTVAVAEIPLCTNQSLCSIITDGTVDTDYLFTYLQFQYNNLRNISNGSSGRGGLNIKLIGQFTVLVPPLAVQQKFSNFLKEIDKSKMAVQKSLDELETLKKSLMQTYFG